LQSLAGGTPDVKADERLKSLSFPPLAGSFSPLSPFLTRHGYMRSNKYIQEIFQVSVIRLFEPVGTEPPHKTSGTGRPFYEDPHNPGSRGDSHGCTGDTGGTGKNCRWPQAGRSSMISNRSFNCSSCCCATQATNCLGHPPETGQSHVNLLVGIIQIEIGIAIEIEKKMAPTNSIAIPIAISIPMKPYLFVTDRTRGPISCPLSLEGEGWGEGGPCERPPPHLASPPEGERNFVFLSAGRG
jgi:hypothetical protein